MCGGAEWQMGGSWGQGPSPYWIWWHERADSIPVEVNVEHGPLSSADAASKALTHSNHRHIHLITCTLGEVGDLECDPGSYPSDGNVGRDAIEGGGSTSTAESFHSEQGGVDVCQMWMFCNSYSGITIYSRVICSLIKCHKIGLVPFLS